MSTDLYKSTSTLNLPQLTFPQQMEDDVEVELELEKQVISVVLQQWWW